MLAGMPYTRLRDAIIAHPTLAESLGALLECADAIRLAQDTRMLVLFEAGGLHLRMAYVLSGELPLCRSAR